MRPASSVTRKATHAVALRVVRRLSAAKRVVPRCEQWVLGSRRLESRNWILTAKARKHPASERLKRLGVRNRIRRRPSTDVGRWRPELCVIQCDASQPLLHVKDASARISEYLNLTIPVDEHRHRFPAFGVDISPVPSIHRSVRHPANVTGRGRDVAIAGDLFYQRPD